MKIKEKVFKTMKNTKTRFFNILRCVDRNPGLQSELRFDAINMQVEIFYIFDSIKKNQNMVEKPSVVFLRSFVSLLSICCHSPVQGKSLGDPYEIVIKWTRSTPE